MDDSTPQERNPLELSYEELQDLSPPEDLGLDRDRGQGRSSSSRIGRFLGSVKQSISSRMPSRAFWGKAASATGRYGARVATKEAVAWEVPGLNAGIAIYETGRWGKEIHHLLREERALAEMAEQSARSAARKEPFHLGAERDRLKELGKAERELGSAWAKGEREASKSQWELHINETAAVRSANDKVQAFAQPSIPEAMSKAADSHTWRQLEVQKFGEAAQGAKTLEGKYLIGTAGEKYQYLLSQASERLGSAHFDRLYHPDRVVRFEKFAAERLYMDGYNPSEIRLAFTEKSPFITGTDHARYLEDLTSSFDRSYVRSDLAQARHTLSQWRVQEHLPEASRHTPAEWQASQKAFARNAEAMSWHRLEESQQMAEVYRFQPGMRLTTKQEYQVELARIHEQSSHLQNFDTRTSVKMMMAGHKPDAVRAALNEASPFAHKAGHVQFQEGQYGSRVVRDAEEFIQKDQSIRDVWRGVNELREVDRIPATETRLDRLGLAHEQVPSNAHHVQHSSQPTRSSVEINPSR
jgi:hypothetical protein